jgi:hypothetical protein
MSALVRLRRILAGMKRYITHDVKEIIAPSSLPDPPGYVAPPPVSLRQRLQAVAVASRRYIDSWNPDKLQAELRKRGLLDEETIAQEAAENEAELKALTSEVSQTVKGGASALGPYMQHLYRTRVGSYRDAVRQFIEGYKEGFREGRHGEKQMEKDRRSAANLQSASSVVVEREEEEKKVRRKEDGSTKRHGD